MPMGARSSSTNSRERQQWVQTQLLDLLSATSNEVRVSRMGEESKPRICDVKVVIAINEPLTDLVASGHFEPTCVTVCGTS